MSFLSAFLLKQSEFVILRQLQRVYHNLKSFACALKAARCMGIRAKIEFTTAILGDAVWAESRLLRSFL